MSKRQIKSQASSARAASSAFGGGFGASSSPAFGISSSQLSYVAEPPNLTSISDPNVVVYFRNLSKRDSTTKAKALEDLLAHVAALKTPLEEGLLEAWIKMYPRTAIDNAKSVRHNAHILQGQLAAAAGKRFAKYMPKSVGAWLCGLYDSDRSVVEAAQSSLRLVFSTPEKIQNIRRAYQQPILEYCRDAIDKETALTLSDERTVSPDDAQAKYSRVISACIALLGSLLANLQPEELSKHQPEYDSLINDKKLWDFASYDDAPIRRAVHRFLKTCLSRQPEAMKTNLVTISKAYLSSSLNSDQVGSALDYVEALVQLTSGHPTVWTVHYKSKTPVDRRLCQFLKKGSQSGPREFWNQLVHLFKAMPTEVLPKDAADAAELLSALHTGVSGKDESRLGLESAFNAYLEVATTTAASLPKEDQRKLAEELVLPLITQYLRPNPDNTLWNLPQSSIVLLAKAVKLGPMPTILQEKWPDYTKQLVNDIRTSAPEQSKDYERSQNALIQRTSRFAILQEQAAHAEASHTLRVVLTQCTSLVISEALSVVKTRNGKPYGAAGAIAELLHRNGDIVQSDQSSQEQLDQFVREDLPQLILTPSSSYLADILYTMSESPSFEIAWTSSLRVVINGDESPTMPKALEAILTSPRLSKSFELALHDTDLQTYIKSRVESALEGNQEWDFLSQILQSPANVLSAHTVEYILFAMTESLSSSLKAPYALQGLRHIIKQNPSMLKAFLSTPSGSTLLQGLLLASESSNEEISQGAASLSSSIQTLLAAGSDTKQKVYELIQQGLLESTPTSVSVETLVELAKQLVKHGSDWGDIERVLPSAEAWDSTLAPFLKMAPKSSLAITNPLGGAVYLVTTDGIPCTSKLPRDADGYSAAYRIAQYVTRLFKGGDLFPVETVPPQLRETFLRNISLTMQLADDNLGLAGANALWIEYSPDVEADASSFISDAQAFVGLILRQTRAGQSNDDSPFSLLAWGIETLANVGADTSAQTCYCARAYSTLVADAVEIHGWKNSYTSQMQALFRTVRRSKEIFPVVSFVHAFREPLAASKSCERMCNEIVADLTGLEIESKPEEGLRQLVFLNMILYGQEDIAHSIAKQRLIFFVKHVIPWLQDQTNVLALRAEICRAFAVLLPIMGDIYGEHWGQIMTALTESWSNTKELEEDESGMDSPIPFVHASLKLYAQLRNLTEVEDPNDDLLDAWRETEQAVATGLVNLLKHSQHFPDEFHQPLKMVNDVLARQIAKVPLKNLESTEELFPLLYVESQPVQQTAFAILHKQIPTTMEQISIDAALDKTTARLPEELLSLILEAPTVAALSEANFERNVPLPLRGYLLSWLLVFDHLQYASFKVKNDYVEHIKEGDYLPGLLDFTFDFLGHARNKPVDVSKLDITTYTPDVELPNRDVQWLLTHIYYHCLLHLPSLTKSWYIDCKSRPIAVTLEPWTEKYISPPVIAAALNAVQEWATTQSTSDPDSPFTVKASPRAGEITASYTIDEQTMSMRITLPPAFPLTNAHIEGLNRVAVNEQKWQSWLRTSLGAITIFNGSLIDALTTFKRNVDGAMKGQTECAICYSIVGADRKLPDKRCLTCRNLFHGGCLFKWFKSSGSSSCPLCRNPFNYG